MTIPPIIRTPSSPATNIHYDADVTGIKVKKLLELNDDFAKDVSDATTLDELKKKIRESLEHEREHRRKDLSAKKSSSS